VTLGGTGSVLATVIACLAPAWRPALVEPKIALKDAQYRGAMSSSE
jgi:hypothetical protein